MGIIMAKNDERLWVNLFKLKVSVFEMIN